MAKYERYALQWASLNGVLASMYNLYNGSGINRERVFLQLVRSLHLYGEGQFRFFYDGFAYNDERAAGTYGGGYPQLAQSVKYPPEHVLATTLAQISIDISLIQRAAEQRRMGTRAFLEKVDRLAMRALWPASPSIPNDGEPRFERVEDKRDCTFPDFDPRTVLTYFADSVQVRIVPYSQVALVGIPYTCLEDYKALLAIPHEIGHFRYWYSFLQQNTAKWWTPEIDGLYLNIRELFYEYDETPILPTWSEEIFADVYGTLMGGPLAALTAQDMALEHSKGVFEALNTTDVHPTPLLRPLVHIKALNAFNNGTRDLLINAPAPDPTTVARELFNRWQRTLESERGLMTFSGTDILGAAALESDDTKDLKFNFVPTAAGLAAQLSTMLKWSPTLDLSLNALGEPLYPIDHKINQAVEILRMVFEYSQVNPRDWGLAPSGTWGSVQQLYDNAHGIIDAILQAAQPVSDAPLTFLDGGTLEDKEKYEGKDPCVPANNPPTLWHDWADKKGKQYFTFAFPTPPLQVVPEGSLVEMDPTRKAADGSAIPPTQDIWFRVFGAGGWTTEGPCTEPPH